MLASEELMAKKKRIQIVAIAIARELAAFMWITAQVTEALT